MNARRCFTAFQAHGRCDSDAEQIDPSRRTNQLQAHAPRTLGATSSPSRRMFAATQALNKSIPAAEQINVRRMFHNSPPGNQMFFRRMFQGDS
jgi:hypothetical protein